MKKLFYSLCGLIFLLPASLLAEDTFYVNSSGGNNANAGTQESPWRDLNPSRWTDNCTVIVQGEIYVDPEIDVSAGETLKKITIRGANESAALMGLDDDLYADPEEWNISRMFVVNECELTLRNITLKNMKRDGARDEGIPGAGGMIFVGPYGTLNMENVIVKNSVLKNREMWGGAINSEGTLNIRNSVFENCAAYQGGVFYIQNTEAQAVAVFEGCTFKNNTTHAGIPLPYPGGGVFWIQGNNLNISFDKCYFESNVCTNTSAWAGEPRGGAIRMQGMGGNVTFSMKNSVAANNKSEGEGAFAQISKASGNLNFSFINNVFYKNAVTNPAFPNGQCIGFSGQAADHDMTGSSLVFVNNTSLFNQIPGQANQASYYSTSWNKADAIIFANNLFLDRIEPEGEAERTQGTHPD